MPRSSATSSSSKRQNHHSHSQGHVNGGLVLPVKRPLRSRSSSNTVASAASVYSQNAPMYEQSSSGQPTQQHQSQSLHQHQLQPQRSLSDASSISSSEPGSDWGIRTDGAPYSDGPGEDMGMTYSNKLNGSAGEGEHRKIDINPSGEKSRFFGGSNFGTVLPSFPLLDSITLLIIFLQLPSTVLTIIHFLFATMTFVPPSTTLLGASTASSIPSFTTLLLQGSAGSPSILTVILADILVAIISIFLWPSARSLLIDFAQAVMAISLGAGNTGQTGGTFRNAAVCAGVISGVKALKGRYDFGVHWAVHSGPASESGSPGFGFTGAPTTSASWVRNALAVHIVAQGAMRALRGWLIHRPEISSSSDLSSAGASGGLSAKEGISITGKQKDKDPETGTTAASQLSSSSLVPDGGRRKRKQNSIVRSRQPLWAAVASTIVHIAKGFEQSQAVSEATHPEDEAPSGSSEHKALGLEGRVWITSVGSTEITFGAGNFSSLCSEEGDDDVGGNPGVVGSGKNVCAPFFVRVNGIAWPQTEIYRPVDKEGDVENEAAAEWRDEVWVIEISGLTPTTEYDFEFVRLKGGLAFYQTSACTMPAQASSIATPVPPPTSRPLSPITTLLNTLSQANTTVAEQKLRLKRQKKENNRRLASIRSEIDTLRSRLGSGDKGEERARRRVLSLREFVRRAEEEIEKMTAELARLQSIPESVQKEWQEKKKLWQEEQSRLMDVKTKVEETKAAASRHASAVETEAASLAAKQDRLSIRLAKLKGDLQKLTAENVAAKEEKARKQAEREALVKHRAAMDLEFSQAIGNVEKKMQEYRIQARDNWSMIMALENAAAMQMPSVFPPSTPEGSMPGNRLSVGPSGSSTSVLLPPTSTTVGAPPGFGPILPNSALSAGRERSSSMFSSNSKNSLTDPISGDRPSLPTFGSFGGFGNGAFDTGAQATPARHRASFGSVGAIKPAPGFERFGSLSKTGNGAPRNLMVFGEPH